jgi:hypothetical protein
MIQFKQETMMKRTTTLSLAAVGALVSLGLVAGVQAQQPTMTFFVTSIGLGNGANLGGLSGADLHCQRLAQAVGAGNRTWRAYLSTQAVGSAAPVNARDRIGQGPWLNANGVVVAQNLDHLHGDNNLNKGTALSEKGAVIPGRGDNPNQHDALTGSQMDGRAYGPGEDKTCGNWTKSGAAGAAQLGHIDRQGLSDTVEAKSWNSSHPSRGPGGGCTQSDLVSTGGAGLFYCFAVN